MAESASAPAAPMADASAAAPAPSTAPTPGPVAPVPAPAAPVIALANVQEYAVETDSFVKHNLETRQELELWIKAQQRTWVKEQARLQADTQDMQHQRSEAERKREHLQEECRDLNASTCRGSGGICR